MIDSGGEGDAVVAMAAFTCAVDDLANLPLTSLPGLALVEVAHLVEVQLRRMAAFDHALIAALAGSAVHTDLGAHRPGCAHDLGTAAAGVDDCPRSRRPPGSRPRRTWDRGPMSPALRWNRCTPTSPPDKPAACCPPDTRG